MAVSRSFLWKSRSFLLLVAIVELLSYIGKHGLFHLSKTDRFLKDVSALQYGEESWAKTKFYCSESLRWAEENILGYYNIVGDHVKPYLEFSRDVCLIAHHQLRDIYGNICAYVEENILSVTEWIGICAPWLIDNEKTRFTKAWEFTKKNVSILLHLSPENLQKYWRETVNTTQVYAARTYDWVRQNCNIIKDLVTWSEVGFFFY
jgi:hypothetical protein